MEGRKDSLSHVRGKFLWQFRMSARKLCNNLLDAPLYACEDGLSLISTLWMLTVLSVLATHFLYSIRLEQRAQANFAERTKFHYAAKAGFERASCDAAWG